MPKDKVTASVGKRCCTCGGPVKPQPKLMPMSPEDRKAFNVMWLKLLNHPNVAPVLDEQLTIGRKVAKILSILQLEKYEQLEKLWSDERKGRKKFEAEKKVFFIAKCYKLTCSNDCHSSSILQPKEKIQNSDIY